MFTCPNCRSRLHRTQNALGLYWVCGACGGRTVSASVLRKSVGERFVTQLWLAGRDCPRGVKRCPTCGHGMIQVNAGKQNELELDLCRICQFIWFDAAEMESLPRAPVLPLQSPQNILPQRAREEIALHEVRRLAEQAADEASARGPEDTWQYLPALFGMPVECDQKPCANVPLATWVLAASIALVSIFAFFDLEAVVDRFGLIPSDPWRLGGTTTVTSFFLHAGILHLLGNLYFLVVFGDNVEDLMGKLRFLFLVLGATVLGDVFHILGDPRSDQPCIGASGGISGLIVFYALAFPKVRLGLFVRWYWMRIPAWGALLCWLIMQVLGAWKQLAGFSNVSALAHLGGATVGVLAWSICRIRQRQLSCTRPDLG